MYKIEYTKIAIRNLKKIPLNTQNHIKQKINDVAANPFAINNNVAKLVGEELYRLRIGNYRVIYQLKDKEVIIAILKVKPRDDAYH